VRLIRTGNCQSIRFLETIKKKASFGFSQKKNIGYALGQEIVDLSSFEKN
jgi:hypothetical protein